MTAHTTIEPMHNIAPNHISGTKPAINPLFLVVIHQIAGPNQKSSPIQNITLITATGLVNLGLTTWLLSGTGGCSWRRFNRA